MKNLDSWWVFGDHCLAIQSSRLRPAGRCQWTVHCTVFSIDWADNLRWLYSGVYGRVGWSAATGGWAGQRSSGVQEVGPLTPSLPPSSPHPAEPKTSTESWKGVTIQQLASTIWCYSRAYCTVPFPHPLTVLLTQHVKGCLQRCVCPTCHTCPLPKSNSLFWRNC